MAGLSVDATGGADIGHNYHRVTYFTTRSVRCGRAVCGFAHKDS